MHPPFQKLSQSLLPHQASIKAEFTLPQFKFRSIEIHDFSPNFALGLEDKQTASPALGNHKRVKSPTALSLQDQTSNTSSRPSPKKVPRLPSFSKHKHPNNEASTSTAQSARQHAKHSYLRQTLYYPHTRGGNWITEIMSNLPRSYRQLINGKVGLQTQAESSSLCYYHCLMPLTYY